MRLSPILRVLALCLAVVPIAFAGQGRAGAPGQAGAPAVPLGPNALFTVAVSTTTLEGTPVYIADEGPRGAPFQVINGGVRTLANDGAHAATNATTQMLIVLRDNPKVRLLFTLAEGLYRIVAKRSVGINRLADLRGKRIVVPRNTSAHYYLVAMLRSAGLQESDVTLVAAPATEMAAAVTKGDADAITMWEPESQNAVEALGTDAVIFQNNTIYREFFSVYSSTDVLNDARRRRELVEFVRAVLASTEELKREPRRFFPLISRVTRHPEHADCARLGASQVPVGGSLRPSRHRHRRGEMGGDESDASGSNPQRARGIHRYVDHQRGAGNAVNPQPSYSRVSTACGRDYRVVVLQ